MKCEELAWRMQIKNIQQLPVMSGFALRNYVIADSSVQTYFGQ